MVDGIDLTLFSDVYFWAALGLFILSLAGIFLILKALQKTSEEESTASDDEPDFSQTVRISPPAAPPAAKISLESLADQIRKVESSIALLDKKLQEHNTDQMNEMAGHLKLIVQMLKSIYNNSSSGDGAGAVQEKVDKIYQILSTLSQSEQK